MFTKKDKSRFSRTRVKWSSAITGSREGIKGAGMADIKHLMALSRLNLDVSVLKTM